MPSFKKVKELLKLPSLQDKFNERAAKVLVEINKMPKGTAYTAYLKEALDDAKRLSKSDLKDAYAELKRINAEAKKAANGYSDGPSVDNLAKLIDYFSTQGDVIEHRLNTVKDNMDDIYNDIKQLPTPKSLKTLDDKLALKARHQEIEQGLFIKYIGQNYAREQVLAFLAKVDVATTASELEKQIGLLSKKKKKEAPALKKSLLAAKNKYRLNGKALTPELAQTVFTSQHDLYMKNFRKWVDGFNKVEPKPDSFAHLEKKERERLERAMKDYNAGAEMDYWVEETFTKEPKRAPTDLASWGSSASSTDFTDDLVSGDIKNISNADVLKSCSNVRKKTKQLIQNLTQGNVDSDVVFDLSLKSKDELKKYFAESIGIPIDQATPEQLKLFDSLATAMADEIRKANPNRASDKMSSLPLVNNPKKTCDVPEDVTVNGVTYSNPKVIGEGGLGAITEYTDQNGNPVIVKTAKIDPDANDEQREDKRQEMVHELKMHRQIMGGEAGNGHDNVVSMKGVVVSADGGMHMVMEKADGGDCKQLGNNLIYATESGLISQEVRNAMNQDAIAQAVKGLKHMQEQNMLHHDIKPENFLVDENGTIKLADFGSAQSADSEGEVSRPKSGTTGVYESPEVGSMVKTVTGKADTYTLGTMIASMVSPTMGLDRIEGTGNFELPDFKGKTGSTALDRMMNAMLDPDPSKRPTLEAIEASVFFDNQGGDPEALNEIKKLNIEISKKVGRSVGKKQEELNHLNSECKLLEKAKQLPTEVRSDENLTSLFQKLDREQANIALGRKNRAELEEKAAAEADPKKRDTLEFNISNINYQLQKASREGLTAAIRAKAVLQSSPTGNPDPEKLAEAEAYIKAFESDLDAMMKLQREKMESVKNDIQVEMDKPEVKILVAKLKEASDNYTSGKKKSILHDHYMSREIKAFKQQLNEIEQIMSAIPEDQAEEFDTDYRKAHTILVLEKVVDEKAAKDLKKNLAALEKKVKKAIRDLKKDFETSHKDLTTKTGKVKDKEIAKSYTDALKTAATFAKMKSYRVAFRVLDRLEGALEEGVHMNADKVALV